MKIPLSAQIAEATLHRDELQSTLTKRPELLDRLHAAEGIVLTLGLLETTQSEFREFMKLRKDGK